MNIAKDLKKIILFDVDGTLTPARLVIEQPMIECLKKLKERYVIGFVGGSDLVKQQEQLEEHVNLFDYWFSENGLVSYKNKVEFHRASFADHLGPANMKRLINFCLRYVADLDIPLKTGTFFEYRNGLANVSAVGRNCSQKQRIEFVEYNKEHKILENFVAALQKEFADLQLSFSIGGQISFDVFPKGWDKTYCLQFLTEFEEIHFFGDKTGEGGNDFEIFNDSRTVGHSVTTFLDTIKILEEEFLS